MKVVLLVDIKGCGTKGDVIDVGDGYALNSLIPKGKAVDINDGIGKAERNKKEERENARFNKEKNTELSFVSLQSDLNIKLPANENGKLFESVNSTTIAKKLGIPTDWIQCEVIKNIGQYEAVISYKDKKKKVLVTVVGGKN